MQIWPINLSAPGRTTTEGDKGPIDPLNSLSLSPFLTSTQSQYQSEQTTLSEKNDPATPETATNITAQSDKDNSQKSHLKLLGTWQQPQNKRTRQLYGYGNGRRQRA